MKQELLRIAFADDDQDDHLIFVTAIRSVYQMALINCFFNANEILRFYEGPMNISPHIIFLDMNMPGNEDFSCVKKIRHNKRLSNLPVIVYSTSASEAHKEKAALSGSTAFITKPDGLASATRLLSDAIRQYAGSKFCECAPAM